MVTLATDEENKSGKGGRREGHLISRTYIRSPPQLWQWLLRRPCSQMEEPPQLLRWLLRRPCSQLEEPPQLLHDPLIRSCSQMPAPPHSRHTYFSRLWGHFLRIGGMLKALVLLACQCDTPTPCVCCSLAPASAHQRTGPSRCACSNNATRLCLQSLSMSRRSH